MIHSAVSTLRVWHAICVQQSSRLLRMDGNTSGVFSLNYCRSSLWGQFESIISTCLKSLASTIMDAAVVLLWDIEM